jgi:hypothetical protein
MPCCCFPPSAVLVLAFIMKRLEKKEIKQKQKQKQKKVEK